MSRYFSLDTLRQLRSLLLLGDVIGLLLCCSLSYFLVDSTGILEMTLAQILITMAIYIVSVLTCMVLFGTYRKLWKYANIQDFWVCIFGVTAGAAVSWTITFWAQLPISKIYNFSVFAASVATVIVIRVAYKIVRNAVKMRTSNVNRQRTLIVGAGMASRIILLEMSADVCQYYPVCIVDDDPKKQSRDINSIPVVGKVEDIPQVCHAKNIDTILIAIPSCTVQERKRISSICAKTGCTVKTLPYLHQMIDKESLLKQAETIRIEDLLGRDPIQFNVDELSSFIRDKVCLVTGGGGSIGSELCRQIASFQPEKLIIVDIYENNAYEIQQELLHLYGDKLDLYVHIASVRDFAKMDRLFRMYHPQLVFHAAAHKHVPLMETSPEEAVKNNVIGTLHTAALADSYNCEKFVLISTDKAVNPTNVMGATKRCCEMIVQYMAQQSENTEFVAVRFGNVLGSNGSVIPLFKKQIEDGGPVTVTHPDIIRYFMTIPEAVSLVLQAGYMAHGGEIFVLDMGKPVKIVTLAENLIRMYGYEPNVDIQIVYTGLRPGEKLFEELLMDEEGLKPTYNEKIFIGNQIEVDIDRFIDHMVELSASAKMNDSAAVIRILKQIVPTFTHKDKVADASSAHAV